MTTRRAEKKLRRLDAAAPGHRLPFRQRTRARTKIGLATAARAVEGGTTPIPSLVESILPLRALETPNRGAEAAVALITASVSVYVAELLVMLILDRLQVAPGWGKVLLDSTMLLLLVLPTLWLLVYRPQRRLLEERAQAAQRLAGANVELEALVRERTAELERANADLQQSVGDLRDRTAHSQTLAETVVVMPLMNGSDLARRAILIRPALRVLYISGYTDRALVHQEVRDGATAFLQKPFTPDALARKIRGVLGQPIRNSR